MRASVFFPLYDRSHFAGKNFIKSAPRVRIRAVSDDGSDAFGGRYPGEVTFGPELYRALRETLPRLAQGAGEGLSLEGVYDPPYRPAGHEGASKRSRTLTNILNGSLDFSPLLGPEAEYIDPEGKGRPSDIWVPKKNPDGSPAYRADGTRIFMPVPRVLNLPTYNMSHPLWREDPERAWGLVNGVPDVGSLDEWGSAPVRAGFDGTTEVSEYSGKPVPVSYFKEFMTTARRPGYMEGAEWGALRSAARAMSDEALRKALAERGFDDASDTAVPDGAGNPKSRWRDYNKGAEARRLRGIAAGTDDYVADAGERAAERDKKNEESVVAPGDMAEAKRQLRFLLRKYGDRLSGSGVTEDSVPAALDLYRNSPDIRAMPSVRGPEGDAKWLLLLDRLSKGAR